MHVELIVGNKRSSVRRLIIRDFALIGRNANCDIRVISSEISREHCRLEVIDSKLLLVDLGSTNGTFVDGVKVEAHQELIVGADSCIQIGPAAFKVNIVQSEFEETIIPEETCHNDRAIEKETQGELPLQVEDDVDQTISVGDPELLADEQDEEEDSFLASVTSDAEIPTQSEDTAFDDFLKDI